MAQINPKDLPQIRAFVVEMMEVFFEEIRPSLDFIQAAAFRYKIDNIKRNIDSPEYTRMLYGLTDKFIFVIERNAYVKQRLLEELGGRSGAKRP
jgi:hypothetical protein